MTRAATTSPHHPAWRFVPAAEAEGLDRLDAGFNVYAISGGAHWTTLAEMGVQITEGQRAGRTAARSDLLYRPSNLDRGVVTPSPSQLATAPDIGPRSVGLGDLVISKYLPPRTGLVTGRTPHHPPDGNCVRVLGLTASQGLWLAAVLEHAGFASELGHRFSGRTLPRMGARDLAELPLPPEPVGVEEMADTWRTSADALLAAQRGLHDLQVEVQVLADDSAPTLPDPDVPVWVSADEIPETWAPDQAALAHYQRQLTEGGWSPLEHFLASDPPRLRSAIPPARLLHLQDATDDLGFRLPPLAPIRPPLFRIYSAPLRQAEVLLSTLGSAPKVVLNTPRAPSTVWVSDQWARLDPGEHPGALALLLGVSQVLWQLGRAATGVVRQFISRSDLGRVCIPTLVGAQRASLHHRLVEVLTRRSQAHARLDALRLELAGLVTTALEAR